jgi:hypothetical protein
MTALILVLLIVATAVPAALASGSYSARTPISGADSDKLNNLRLAAQAIDGVTVGAGESFSFNETVGPREKRRGYREAPNGRGALVTGGGVAQVASTLYMALLQMGEAVDIDPVKTYGKRFSDDYVQNPSLAIVTDYDAGIDLSFTNLSNAMTINMWLGEDNLCCAITVGRNGRDEASTKDTPGIPGAWSWLDGDEEDDVPDAWSWLDGDEEDDVPDASSWLDGDEKDDTPDGDDETTTYVDFYRDDASSPDSLGSASINCGGDKDVLHNVALAAECLNDTMLDAGDTFSFNDVVGPRTKKYGYRRAMNGRGAKVTGGGVAQVASALWLAIKDCDDIEILEKSTYGKRYNQRYVSDPADAILTDYASGRDFSFRYTGPESLTVYTWVEEGWLYCEMYER